MGPRMVKANRFHHTFDEGSHGKRKPRRSRGRCRFDVGHLFHRREGRSARLPRLRRQRPRRALLVRGSDLPPVARRPAEQEGARRAHEGDQLHRDAEAAARARHAAPVAAQEDDADGGPAHRGVRAVVVGPGCRRQLQGCDRSQGPAADGPDADPRGRLGADPSRQGADRAESEAKPGRELPLHADRKPSRARSRPRRSTSRSSCTPTTSSTRRPLPRA